MVYEEVLTIEFITFLALVVAALGLLLNFRRSLKRDRERRGEFILEAYKTFITDKGMQDAYYDVEYNRLKYDEDFHMSPKEIDLDRLLGWLDAICYLYLKRLIGKSELQIIAYEISIITANTEVKKYMEFLDNWTHSSRLPHTPFASLRKVGYVLPNAHDD